MLKLSLHLLRRRITVIQYNGCNQDDKTLSNVETLAKLHFAHGSMNGYTPWMIAYTPKQQRAKFLPTLEMVNGVLKSRPPTSRKPQGEGPFSVTVWVMFGNIDCEREADR